MNSQRSILLFEQAIKSEATKKAYLFQLDKFLKFYHIKDHDSLLKIGIEKIQQMLEDYLFELKKEHSQASIQLAFYALELFFSMNDVVLNFKKLRKMFPASTKKSGLKAYTTKDVQKIISISNSRKHKAIVLFLSASGIRIGAIPELRLQHLRDMPLECKALTVYPESKDEYITFLTPETCEALDDYLEERRKDGEYLNPESPIFRADYNKVGIGKTKPLTKSASTGIIYRLITKAQTNRQKQTSTRYTIQGAHGFRKRFNTILKSNNSVNPNLAERLMGHSQTIRLDNSYLDPSIERLFDEYLKVIPELSIDEAVRLKIQNETQQRRIKKLESDKDKRIWNLENKIQSIESLLLRIDTERSIPSSHSKKSLQ